MKTRTLAASAAAALALGTLGALGVSGSAQAVTPTPVTVGFSADSTGAKPNGFASADSPSMLFFDTQGSDLSVFDFGVQSHGQGIEAGPDDTSALEIRLTSPTTAITMSFGNDDPSVANASDQAELTLFRNATQVGQVDVNVNANDVMDQSIRFSDGPLFNRAVLQYVNAAGTPLNLIEVVDDISVSPLCTIAGNTAANVLVGTPGNDVICGDAGADRIKGGGGNDLIYPGFGNDATNGDGGNDTVIDNLGADRINGGTGNDDVRGAAGNDVVLGGPGADQVNGGTGRDHLFGGTGVDRCDGGSNVDRGVSCEVRIHIP